MRFQIRPRDDGRYDVVDVRTGQVHGSGVSLEAARLIQAAWLNDQARKERSPLIASAAASAAVLEGTGHHTPQNETALEVGRSPAMVRRA